MAYVHFKSKDPKMQSMGDFWHKVILNGTAVIAQDKVDTYTVQSMILPGVDIENFWIENPVEFVKESLGGMGGLVDIEIDEVLVSGKWQGDLAIADSFRSERGQVFLAGDAGA
jgi:FAD-dependent monooxygenase